MTFGEALAHGGGAELTRRGIHDYDISPMYRISHEHVLALVLAVIAMAITWRITRAQAGDDRAANGLLAGTGGAHLGLAFGHEPGLRTIGFIAFGVWALWAARSWSRRGEPARRTVLVLAASVMTYVVVIVSGEAPDQAGIIVKLAEISCIGLVLGSRAETKTQRLRQSSAIVGSVFFLGVGAWIGAFTGGGHSHTIGETPAPGLALPILETLPTADPAAADALYEGTIDHLAQYEDVAAAASAGYAVDDMDRLGGHADNPEYKDDGALLDPTRPETLVYGAGSDGPVLLGAMYQTDHAGEAGPMVGGALTVWHAHDHVCFSLLPPGLGSLSSPFGMCPLGTVTVALTNEMMHVWTIDGAPERFGDLSDEWLAANLP